MKKVVVVAVLMLSALALAEDKKCAALAEDGTLIAEAAWVGKKSDTCKAQVKEEVKKRCTPETKTVKFQLRLSEGTKPLPSVVTCPSVTNGAAKVDVACLKACSDAQAACHGACDKADKACNQGCLSTVKTCNAACSR
jgi:hypothetical protein